MSLDPNYILLGSEQENGTSTFGSVLIQGQGILTSLTMS